MIDLSRFTDDIVLTTTEVHEWTKRPKKAILGSRMPPLVMTSREKHYRASDVKRWVLEGDRAFEAQVDTTTTPPASRARRHLQAVRA